MIGPFRSSSILLSLGTIIGFVVPSLAADRYAKQRSTERITALGSFEVHSYAGGPSAKLVATCCNDLQHQMRIHLLGERSKIGWSPRCLVALHKTGTSYRAAVGRGAAQTSGSSLIERQGNAIVRRRIDVLADHAGDLSSLAHELCHVVLADRFQGRQPPRWADEGIAMLADSVEKQRLHEDDLRSLVSKGRTLRLVEILNAERVARNQMAAFYAQSLSLAKYLTRQRGAVHFVDFVAEAMDRGYDSALRTCYGMDGISELEKRWRDETNLGSHPVPLLNFTSLSVLSENNRPVVFSMSQSSSGLLEESVFAY